MALFEPAQPDHLPLFWEIALDFDSGLPLEQGGQFVFVTGQNALRMWVWKALHPQSQRFACSAHTGAYGNELAQLAGSAAGEAESRLPALLTQALTVNPYILGITDLSCRQTKSGLNAAFTVETVYGPMRYEGEALTI